MDNKWIVPNLVLIGSGPLPDGSVLLGDQYGVWNDLNESFCENDVRSIRVINEELKRKHPHGAHFVLIVRSDDSIFKTPLYRDKEHHLLVLFIYNPMLWIVDKILKLMDVLDERYR